MALVRAIGRVGLTALVVNCIIGTSIFGMPGEVYRQLGRASPLAMVAGALCMAVFIACAAEVGSQFSEAGGPYLYVRTAFGRFAGLLVAWFWFLAGAGGLAAAANLFAAYLGIFVPALTAGWARALTLGLLIAVPTVINCRGVQGGSGLSVFMAFAKITPLVLLALLGVAHFGDSRILPSVSDVMMPGWSAWGTILLLLVSAFGGWEDALAPASEVKQPRHTLPFALAAGLLISAALYAVLQYVVTAAGGAISSTRLAGRVGARGAERLGTEFPLQALILYGPSEHALRRQPKATWSRDRPICACSWTAIEDERPRSEPALREVLYAAAVRPRLTGQYRPQAA